MQRLDHNIGKRVIGALFSTGVDILLFCRVSRPDLSPKEPSTEWVFIIIIIIIIIIGTKFLIARYTPHAWRMRARPKKV
jgi:hypothetical protein